MTNAPLQRLLRVIRRQVDPDASGPLADERLLARFAATRDAGAFELLVWRHGAMVHGVCRRVLGDHHAAEDAFQATFLALARKPKAVRTGASLPGWLHRVAHRIAVRARRDGMKRADRDRSAARPELVASEAGNGELRVVIDEEIDRLPDRLRRAVVLCYLEGTTTDHAARLLGCPRGTVLSRLAAARERLKTRLTRRGLAIPVSGFASVVCSAEAPAAVVSLTVKTIIGGSASIPVLGLAQGVLNAMIVSKIKLATAVVVTTGMIGTGVGWVALPGNGPGIVTVAQAAPASPEDEVAQLRLEVQRQRDLATQARLEAEVALAKLRAEKPQNEPDLVLIARRDVALAGVEAAEARFLAAEKLVGLAQEEFSAQQELRKKNSTTMADFRRAQAQLDQAVAGVAEAKGALLKARAEATLANALLEQQRKKPSVVSHDGFVADSRLENNAADRKRAQADIAANQAKWEERRKVEAVELRIRVAEAEERIKALEREQAAEQQRVLQIMGDIRSDIQKHREHKRVLANDIGPDHPKMKEVDSQIKHNDERLAQLEEEYRHGEAKRLGHRMQARKQMVLAEEECKSLERRLAAQDAEFAARRAETHGHGVPMANDDRITALERKIDALARELAQLRKEIKK